MININNINNIIPYLKRANLLLKYHGLPRICNLTLDKDYLYISCVTSVQYICEIPLLDFPNFTSSILLNDTIDLFSYENTITLSVSSEIVSIQSSSIRVIFPTVNQSNYFTLPIKENIFNTQLPLYSISKILKFSILMKLMKIDLNLEFTKNSIKLVFPSCIIEVIAETSFIGSISISDAKLIAMFNPLSISVKDTSIILKNNNEYLIISKNNYISEKFVQENWTHYDFTITSSMIFSLLNITKVLRNDFVDLVFKKSSIEIYSSNVFINWGETTTETLLRIKLPCEIANSIFKSFSTSLDIFYNKQFVKLISGDVSILLRAEVYDEQYN